MPYCRRNGLQLSPKDPAICSLWIKAVHNQRKNWKGPTDASLICSKNFELDCYEQYYREELGLPPKVEVLFQLFSPSLMIAVPAAAKQPPISFRTKKAKGGMHNLKIYCTDC